MQAETAQAKHVTPHTTIMRKAKKLILDNAQQQQRAQAQYKQLH